MANYYPRDDDRGGIQVIRDTESLEASYERYLHSAVLVVLTIPTWLRIYVLISYDPAWHVEFLGR